MTDDNKNQGTLFNDAEILYQDFLTKNSGNKDDALLAACYVILQIDKEREQLIKCSSNGYLRLPLMKK